MSWVGRWRNQYGSILEVSDDADNKVSGVFRTALEDSGFFGKEVRVFGIHRGDCISFAFADATQSGDMICSFTGLMREGKIETVWHVIADGRRSATGDAVEKRAWPHSVTTNADTFERRI
jgi:hypothetical protein